MKHSFVCIAIFIFLSSSSRAQITNHNWLVGGTTYFSSYKSKGPNVATFKRTNLVIAPDLGYFFIDKLAGGLKLGFEHAELHSGAPVIKDNVLNIGPFLRYYFLPTGQRVNFLTQGEYTFGFHKSGPSTSSKSYQYGLSAGPVLYFNTSVGLELTVQYSKTTFQGTEDTENQFQIGLGLQIHLEKDK